MNEIVSHRGVTARERRAFPYPDCSDDLILDPVRPGCHDRHDLLGGVSAQFIAGKATRDALYLANLDVTTLPTIVIATAVVSILLVIASSRGLQRVAPRRSCRSPSHSAALCCLPRGC
jgi:hypothetical protein